MVVLLTSVNSHVRVQVAGAGKSLRTVRTPVRSFRRVYGDGVLRQLLGGGESFAARCAHVVLFPGVSFHVSVQVAPVYESLVAEVTKVRSLAGVNSNVMHEARFRLENFSARVALVLLRQFPRLCTRDRATVYQFVDFQIQIGRLQIAKF